MRRLQLATPQIMRWGFEKQFRRHMYFGRLVLLCV